MKVLHKHVLIALTLTTLFLLPSCDKNDSEEFLSKGEELTLNVQFDGIFAESATRAQGDAPSLNKDVADREDFVEKVAMLIFDSTTGGKVAEAYVEAPTISTKIKEGTYDFFFIANYPGDSTSLNGLSKAEVLAYLQGLRPFIDYQGFTGKDTGEFPMSRVYLNQAVSKGTDPTKTPFNPSVGATTQLAPVSSYGKDVDADVQSKVRFVRACAKMQLNITGEGRADIQDIKYINAAANYTFAELNPLPATQAVATTAPVFTLTANDATQTTTGKLYVPERLFGAAETVAPGWDTTTDEAKGGVNYIQVTMKSGAKYKIPVISNESASTDYMNIAKGKSTTTTPDYNVIRNKQYVYNIILPAEGKIDVSLLVMPWTLVESQYDYVRPTYTIEVIRDGVTMKDIQSEVELPDALDGTVKPVTIKFSISAPLGALWTASITNGLEFDLSGTEHGIVDGTNTTYTMTITPRKPFDKEPRYTQFFISVDGKELFLGYKADGTLDNRYIGEGTPYRWKFKQIMAK